MVCLFKTYAEIQYTVFITRPFLPRRQTCLFMLGFVQGCVLKLVCLSVCFSVCLFVVCQTGRYSVLQACFVAAFVGESPVCLFVLSFCLTVCLSVCLSVCICLSVYLSVCLSVCRSVRLSACLSVCRSVWVPSGGPGANDGHFAAWTAVLRCDVL